MNGVVGGFAALTAVIAVEFARTMAAEGFSGSGALAPAPVVDPEEHLAYLANHGISYSAEKAPAKAR